MTSKAEIKLELAFPFDIQITPTVNGGCIVNVGCAQLSYSTPARMLIDLKKYLADPKGYEKAYMECNKTRGGEVASDTPRPSLGGSGGRIGQIPEQPEAQENRRDPEDHPGDRERREGEKNEQEQADSPR